MGVDPGVVDEDVDAAIRGRGRHRRLACGFLADVARSDGGLAPVPSDLVRDLVELGPSAPGQDDRRPFPGQHQRGDRADARPGPGDDRHLSIEEHARHPSVGRPTN